MPQEQEEADEFFDAPETPVASVPIAGGTEKPRSAAGTLLDGGVRMTEAAQNEGESESPPLSAMRGAAITEPRHAAPFTPSRLSRSYGEGITFSPPNTQAYGSPLGSDAPEAMFMAMKERSAREPNGSELSSSSVEGFPAPPRFASSRPRISPRSWDDDSPLSGSSTLGDGLSSRHRRSDSFGSDISGAGQDDFSVKEKPEVVRSWSDATAFSPDRSSNGGYGPDFEDIGGKRSSSSVHEDHDEKVEKLTILPPQPMADEEAESYGVMPRESRSMDPADHPEPRRRGSGRYDDGEEEGGFGAGILDTVISTIGNHPKMAAALGAVALGAGAKWWMNANSGRAEQEGRSPTEGEQERTGVLGGVTSTMASLTHDGVQAVRNELQFQGTPAITEYGATGMQAHQIRTSHWRRPVTFKISRSNDRPVGTLNRLHKAFGNVVVRRTDKIRLGNMLGTARVHSARGLEDATAKRFGEALVTTFNVIEQLKKEIGDRQKAVGLSGRARKVEPLSDNSRKALQDLGIHETEIDHIDLKKLQRLFDASHPHGQTYSITNHSLGQDTDGVPSKIRSTRSTGERSYGSSGASDFKRASVASVKLEQGLVGEPGHEHEAVAALMKAYVQTTGAESLFKKDYERTSDYVNGRAIPTVADPSRDGVAHNIVNVVKDLGSQAFGAAHDARDLKARDWGIGAMASAAADKLGNGAVAKVKGELESATTERLKEGLAATASRTFNAATRDRTNERKRGVGI